MKGRNQPNPVKATHRAQKGHLSVAFFIIFPTWPNLTTLASKPTVSDRDGAMPTRICHLMHDYSPSGHSPGSRPLFMKGYEQGADDERHHALGESGEQIGALSAPAYVFIPAKSPLRPSLAGMRSKTLR